MVVSYTTEGDTFRAGKPQLWSDQPIQNRGGRAFDVHPDGQRLAVGITPTPPQPGQQDEVVFIFNFFDELRRLARPQR